MSLLDRLRKSIPGWDAQVSNFQSESPPADDMFIEHVVGKLKGSGGEHTRRTLRCLHSVITHTGVS